MPWKITIGYRNKNENEKNEEIHDATMEMRRVMKKKD